ncbi:MAG: mechanosensitive ion channel protein MscL [Dehalococcoidia bacterium SM23_28_2]|nr:MAG: mechanosensitive ion channel protein MscL [Dehalococcoidia bacterium SM23_28_2]
MKLASDFKQFLLRGNFIDMAVALVMALAVFAVVTALIEDLITPIIAAIAGEPDFSALTFEINKSTFRYGDFINALITFIFTAAAVFFFIVVPTNALIARSRTEPPADPTTRKCPECLSEIPVEARRCSFCTSQVPPA